MKTYITYIRNNGSETTVSTSRYNALALVAILSNIGYKIVDINKF